MNSLRQHEGQRAGSVLMAAAIFMAIASLALVSIFFAMGSYTRVNFAAYERERAFQLADAGLQAAILELNNDRSGAIGEGRSRTYLAQTNVMRTASWGFTVTVSNLSETANRVLSQGAYGRSRATVSADVALQSVGQDIHALFAHAIYAGNSSGDTNYVLRIGGTGAGADRVVGDVYSGNDIEVTGEARLWYPEAYTDDDGDGVYGDGETRLDSGTSATFTGPLTAAAFAAYVSSLDPALIYGNGRYDFGEAFVDEVGNGVYDSGEPFVDLDGDGVFGFGDPFEDTDGDGVYDPGEVFVDHGNGTYDAGEAFEDVNGDGAWNPEIPGYVEWVRVGRRWREVWHPPIPAEPYEDLGNGVYDLGETFVDVNGVYDPGDTFFDDRNGRYDFGTTATGTITGMDSPGTNQVAAHGGDPVIAPPDLSKMYYDRPHTIEAPEDALIGWGHDVDVAAAHYDGNGRAVNWKDPAHIFVKNPTDRQYVPIPGKNDYFLEDPWDKSYGASHQYLNVDSNGNNKVYYVDGNLYIHNPDTYDFMFREPGVRITIVANGNITISDEFWYNGGVANPQDSLALIAMKDESVANSGNIYLGDAQFGTGGDVHAMLYAENNFVDNNLDTTGQPYLSVFGNMTAGNQVAINRSGSRRTRLEVMLDERIVSRRNLPPGLPQATAGQRSIVVERSWQMVQGTWNSFSPLN